MAIRIYRTGISERDHNLLENRDLPNQHPIQAIDGLEEKINDILKSIDDKISSMDLSSVASKLISDNTTETCKTWSSSKISKIAEDAKKIDNVYTKEEANNLFGLKEKEHFHNNLKDVLDKLGVEDNYLTFNGTKIAGNLKPTLKETVWKNKNNENLELILDVSSVIEKLQGIILSNSELTIRNDNPLDSGTTIQLVVKDNEFVTLDEEIKPQEVQRYLLGTSPETKVYVKGKYSGKYHMQCLDMIQNMNIVGKEKFKKFAQLLDVDVTNVRDKQIIGYSAATKKFTSVDLKDVGSGGGNVEINQVTKLGLQASKDSPHTVHILINSLEFKHPKVNVLKFEQGDQNVISVQNDFTNGERTDFDNDDFVEFDGTAHLKLTHEYKYSMVDQKEDIDHIYNETEIDLSEFKYIDKISDTKSNISIHAIPTDRIIKPKGDRVLANVEHIDYFKINATGDNIKMGVSNDNGHTWYTFDSFHNGWKQLELSVDNLKTKGIAINTFNNISEKKWNELIDNKTIRICYLLSMEDFNDKEEIDKLESQFDMCGKWRELKDVDYDVLYVSNTELNVKLYISGDIKINY